MNPDEITPADVENLIGALAIQRNRALDQAAQLAARLARAETAAAALKTELDELKANAVTTKPRQPATKKPRK